MLGTTALGRSSRRVKGFAFGSALTCGPAELGARLGWAEGGRPHVGLWDPEYPAILLPHLGLPLNPCVVYTQGLFPGTYTN